MAQSMLVILGALLFQFCLVLGLKLYQESPCRCRLENGTIIDLNKISSVGKPSFIDQRANSSTDTATYFYNPCNAFTMADSCQNVAVCQKTADGQYYSLGGLASAKFVYNESTNTIIIMYEADIRKVNVSLHCSPKDNFPRLMVLGETIPGNSSIYQMLLFSECACPNGCLEKTAAEVGLSTGSILIIIALVFFLVYLLSGMIFLHFVQGATGWETIPNHTFWFGLPALIRDGIVFAMSGCKVDETYDRI